MTVFQQLLKTQVAFEAQLLAKPNVVGVAVGFKESHGHITDEMVVVALVEKKEPISALSVEERVPTSVGGVRTDVYEVGRLVAQQLPSPRQQFRPAPGGVSIGHYAITAGTLGAVVRDRNTGRRLILSNNHVLANSNDAEVGDAIIQPGQTDGGSAPANTIATLERFIPMRYIGDPVAPNPPPITPPPGTGGGGGGTNGDALGCVVGGAVALANLIAGMTGSGKRVVVQSSIGAQSADPTMPEPVATRQTLAAHSADNALDAALAAPVDDSLLEDEILGIGTINGTKAPILGMQVRKSGRTTGLTTGTVQLLNATVNVAYGARTARFTGQVITSAMSQGGDSGSLVVDGSENKAVGLLFAGSPVATIFTPIDVVLAALDVAFATDLTV